MKLLLDNNLSFKLVRHLQIHFPQSNHIRNNVGVDANDETIWNYAKQNDFIILTKDNDFELFADPTVADCILKIG